MSSTKQNFPLCIEEFVSPDSLSLPTQAAELIAARLLCSDANTGGVDRADILYNVSKLLTALMIGSAKVSEQYSPTHCPNRTLGL